MKQATYKKQLANSLNPGLYIQESRSLQGIILPAHVHEGVERGGAFHGEGQALSRLNLADDLIILDADEGLDPSHEDLPAAHPKHPHVTQPGEPTEVDTLRSHPLDGKLSSRGW